MADRHALGLVVIASLAALAIAYAWPHTHSPAPAEPAAASYDPNVLVVTCTQGEIFADGNHAAIEYAIRSAPHVGGRVGFRGVCTLNRPVVFDGPKVAGESLTIEGGTFELTNGAPYALLFSGLDSHVEALR